MHDVTLIMVQQQNVKQSGRYIFMDRQKPRLLTLRHITHITTWDACAGTTYIFNIPGTIHGLGNPPNKLTV